MGILGLFGRHKPDLRVIIDVGSKSIKAIIFEVSSRGYPKILRKMIYRLPSRSGPERVALKLREFLFEIVKNIGRIPRKIIAAVGPNLADSSLDTWTNPNVEVLKSVMGRDLKSLFEKLAIQNHEVGRILISHPTEVFINGYAVTDFFAGYRDINRVVPKEMRLDALRTLRNAEISFRVFESYLDEKAGSILEDAKKSLGGMPIEFIPIAIAYKGVASSALNIKDALLIDMGGERTSLSFLKDGEVIQFSAFPVGARHFVRGIAELASISFEEAETESRQYVQGLVKESKRSQLNDFLIKESALWDRELNRALEDFFPLGPLPGKVLLFGGGANFPEIVSILSKPEWMKNLSYADTPEVRVLRGESIFEGNKFGGVIAGPEEVGLASLLHYALYYEPMF